MNDVFVILRVLQDFLVVWGGGVSEGDKSE